MALAIELLPQQEQTAFNLHCWEEILADSELAGLNQRIETNRHGNIIMSPPPGNPHSFKQSDLLILVSSLRPDGRSQVEVPISTSDGIRAADVAWTSDERFSKIYDSRAYKAAPDLCIEVVSPANTPREMAEKKALYFDAGATEVWLCQIDGTLEFFYQDDPDKIRKTSALFPTIPTKIKSP